MIGVDSCFYDTSWPNKWVNSGEIDPFRKISCGIRFFNLYDKSPETLWELRSIRASRQFLAIFWFLTMCALETGWLGWQFRWFLETVLARWIAGSPVCACDSLEARWLGRWLHLCVLRNTLRLLLLMCSLTVTSVADLIYVCLEARWLGQKPCFLSAGTLL